MSDPSRRRFLLLGGALGATAWVAWQVQGRWPLAGPLVAGRSSLTDAQRTTLARAAGAALDDRAAGELVAQDMDRWFAGGGADSAPDMAMALSLLEFVPAGLGGPRRFSRLSLTEATEVLEAWERSALGVRRQIARAVRDAARFTWFAREETWAALQYEGTWLGGRR